MGPKLEDDPAAGTLVELLEGATHNLEEGNTLTFKEVIGMQNCELGKEFTSINDMSFKVTEVINRNKFVIDCDTSSYTHYQRNGVAK